ncbi:MAG TPA: DUF3617 family protein [Thermoanaerobaculia bacterium]|jgi:hypothetical protein
MKKVYGTVLLSAIALTLTSTPSLQAAERANVGQWEFTSTVDGAAKTRTYCITPTQVKGINGDAQADQAFLEKGAAARHCTIKDFKLEGNTLSYTQVCAGYTFSDRTTYSGDSSEGVLTTKMDGKAAVVTHMKGRRLGACK